MDGDLGFVFWLGQALDSAGYTAVPAKDLASANELLRTHRLSVDILVIDPEVPGALGFISQFRQTGKSLRVLGVIARDENAVPSSEIDATVWKPDHLTPDAAAEWIYAIQNLLSLSNPRKFSQMRS